MSLENLLKINQLQRHKAKAEEVQRYWLQQIAIWPTVPYRA